MFAEVRILPFIESRGLSFDGVQILFKGMGEDVRGRWSMFEYTLPARHVGSFAHYHWQTDQKFYIIEGELTFEIEGETVESAAGDFITIGRGKVHRFVNRADKPVRFLMIVSPTPIDGYFIELAESELTLTPEEMDRLGAAYDQYAPER